MKKYLLVVDTIGSQPGMDPGFDRYFIGKEAPPDRWNGQRLHPLMGFQNGTFVASAEASSIKELKENLRAMLKACDEAPVRLVEKHEITLKSERVPV